MILVEMTRQSVIIMSLIAYVVGIFYMLSGLSLIIHKEQRTFGKDKIYKNPQQLNLILGIVEVIAASLTIVLNTLGLILREHYFIFVLIAALIVLLSVLFDVFYPKTRRIR